MSLPPSQHSNSVTWCYHGRRGPGHVYEPGEYCPPDGPDVDGDCRGCGAPRGYPPAGPCLSHGKADARALTGKESSHG